MTIIIISVICDMYNISHNYNNNNVAANVLIEIVVALITMMMVVFFADADDNRTMKI